MARNKLLKCSCGETPTVEEHNTRLYSGERVWWCDITCDACGENVYGHEEATPTEAIESAIEDWNWFRKREETND